MYDNLSHKIELNASKKSNPCDGEFDVFSNTQRTNHPSIIQVYNFNASPLVTIHDTNNALLMYLIKCKNL